MRLTCTFYLLPESKQEAGAEIKAVEGNAWNPSQPGISHFISGPKYPLSISQVPSSVPGPEDGMGSQTVPALGWLVIYW